jgi:hypothetical protein
MAGVAALGFVGGLVVFAVGNEPGQRVISTGAPPPSTIPADTPALEAFHPIDPVTVIDEGMVEGVPWQLIVFRGSLDTAVELPEPTGDPVVGGTKPVTCHVLLDPRSDAALPAGGGACAHPDQGSAGEAGGHGFAYIDGVTFVIGDAGEGVAAVRIELRDGHRVEVARAPRLAPVAGTGWRRCRAAVIARTTSNGPTPTSMPSCGSTHAARTRDR